MSAKAPERKTLPKKYRHEQKYYICQADYELISRRLSLSMERDRYADENGEYFIRSLYFDDMNDSAFRDKLDGVDSRDKYRLRTYNLEDKVIKLEKKHKDGQFIQKSSVSLTRRECDELLAGRYAFLLSRPEPFAREMFAVFATRRLRPKVIVDYVREAYVFPVQDVRITFDKEIRSGYRGVDIFDKELPTYPVLDSGDMVMEVKFNLYLPTYIRSLIQMPAQVRSAVSKYCICRKFEL